jgi:hypothetical protein
MPKHNLRLLLKRDLFYSLAAQRLRITGKQKACLDLALNRPASKPSIVAYRTVQVSQLFFAKLPFRS